ncbi:hypothetical protein AVEN_147602-1 [Araneus ventricosus]|uniref:Uncharacterized protein n=1 Tax=Araneus ventricosus TaxID=182803 RepID=A0A4Y2H1V3_ARAVE|nr:hypothetical protein AVEN_147602-1 [Araneus ventricosus]
MEKIYTYLDGRDDCQYSVNELMQQISGEKPSPATFRRKMKEKYGDRIVFSTVRKRKTVVCFRYASEKIINDTWYTSKLSDEETGRERTVRTAGAILLEDMQLMAYDTTVSHLVTISAVGLRKWCLRLSRHSWGSLSGKKRDDEKMRKNLTAIAHAIISTIRPRTILFVSYPAWYCSVC